MKTCVFAGTFDPFSNGHADVTKRAAEIFDKVIIAVSSSPNKKPMFSLDDRVKIAELAVKNIKNTSVMPFDCLLTDFMKSNNAMYLVRGLRTNMDFEYESSLFGAYKSQLPSIECVYFMAREKHIQSVFIRELILYGGDYSAYVSEDVRKYIKVIDKR